MADAFRIAFEQQLMQRKDQALRLAEVIKTKKETKFANWRRLRGTGNWAVCVSRGWLAEEGAGAALPVLNVCWWLSCWPRDMDSK